jgi:hypothetical protein
VGATGAEHGQTVRTRLTRNTLETLLQLVDAREVTAGPIPARFSTFTILTTLTGSHSIEAAG